MSAYNWKRNFRGLGSKTKGGNKRPGKRAKNNLKNHQ